MIQTKYLGDIRCYCGKHGALKADMRWPTTCYYVLHYKRYGVGWADHSSKYVATHYIGSKLQLGGAMP